MKFTYTSLLMCFLCFALKAQIPHPLIKQLVSDMKEDSISTRLKELSGEQSCLIKGKTSTIKNRVSKTGNDLAADYLKERMESYGLTVTDQKYSSGGRNIIAEQKGALYPDKKYIMCAHYDAMADYCADDDASSCAAILETVRLLTKHKFKYTIVYAFWDEEEQGLIGSAYYAKLVKNNKENIVGVLNIEMLGYDSDNDTKFDIHANSASTALANKLKDVNTGYAFKLKPFLPNPPTDRSDHGSFWKEGYSAICFGEAFMSGDPNPSYHKSSDRISLFNLPYYYNLCRLSLAGIATLAEPYDITGIGTPDTEKIKLETYPNPAKELLTVCYELAAPETIQIKLYTIAGEESKLLLSETKAAGAYQQVINTEALASGMYIISIETHSASYSKKIMVEK